MKKYFSAFIFVGSTMCSAQFAQAQPNCATIASRINAHFERGLEIIGGARQSIDFGANNMDVFHSQARSMEGRTVSVPVGTFNAMGTVTVDLRTLALDVGQASQEFSVKRSQLIDELYGCL